MTSSQSRAHFLRHVKGRPHVAQVFVGRSAFLRMEGSIQLVWRATAAKIVSMAEVLSFERRGRQPRNVAITGAAVIALIAAVVILDLHPVIAAMIAVMMLPAIWDIVVGADATMTIDDTNLTWRMGGRGDSYELDEIERVTTKLSWDFSRKATVFTKSGTKHRIPPPCLPPDVPFDLALKARGVAVTRSLF